VLRGDHSLSLKLPCLWHFYRPRTHRDAGGAWLRARLSAYSVRQWVFLCCTRSGPWCMIRSHSDHGSRGALGNGARRGPVTHSVCVPAEDATLCQNVNAL
jgi:hypothetical protein